MAQGTRRQMGQVRISSSFLREERRAAEGGFVLLLLVHVLPVGLAAQSRLESGEASDGTAAEEEATGAAGARFFFAGGIWGGGGRANGRNHSGPRYSTLE